MIGSERIILVGGPGGVGKTTLAASIGLSLALKGHRTLILTVDPARRLAQALGFAGFSSDIQPVPLDSFSGVPSSGKLYATMLDARRYFDRIIDKFAPTSEQRQKILTNPIYQTMVESLGGTQEYAAMERLFEFSEDPSYDRIVVDTPPTQNAVDLLMAPQRLADFMDNSVLRWFQGPKPYYLKLFQTGTRVAMKLLQKVFGSEFLESFANLMDSIDGMQAGFRRRNLEVLELLRSRDSAFLLVTLATAARYQETVEFSQTLSEQKITLKGIVLNRVEDPCSLSPGDMDRWQGDSRREVERWLEYVQALYSNQHEIVERFSRHLPNISLRQIPFRPGSLQDLQSLSELGRLLVS